MAATTGLTIRVGGDESVGVNIEFARGSQSDSSDMSPPPLDSPTTPSPSSAEIQRIMGTSSQKKNNNMTAEEQLKFLSSSFVADEEKEEEEEEAKDHATEIRKGILGAILKAKRDELLQQADQAINSLPSGFDEGKKLELIKLRDLMANEMDKKIDNVLAPFESKDEVPKLSEVPKQPLKNLAYHHHEIVHRHDFINLLANGKYQLKLLDEGYDVAFFNIIDCWTFKPFYDKKSGKNVWSIEIPALGGAHGTDIDIRGAGEKATHFVMEDDRPNIGSVHSFLVRRQQQWGKKRKRIQNTTEIIFVACCSHRLRLAKGQMWYCRKKDRPIVMTIPEHTTDFHYVRLIE